MCRVFEPNSRIGRKSGTTLKRRECEPKNEIRSPRLRLSRAGFSQRRGGVSDRTVVKTRLTQTARAPNEKNKLFRSLDAVSCTDRPLQIKRSKSHVGALFKFAADANRGSSRSPTQGETKEKKRTGRVAQSKFFASLETETSRIHRSRSGFLPLRESPFQVAVKLGTRDSSSFIVNQTRAPPFERSRVNATRPGIWFPRILPTRVN